MATKGTTGPKIEAVRQDDGLASFTYTDGAYTRTASGFWDDATPWASGNYSLKFHYHPGRPATVNTLGLSGFPNNPGNLIQYGESTEWSRGSLIVNDLNFLEDIYNDVKKAGFSTGYESLSPISCSVSGDFGVSLNISATTKVAAGDEISVTVSLTGPGATNGFSKDVYVKLKSGASESAVEGVDFDSLSSLKSEVSITDHGRGWIKIAKGTTNTTVIVPTIATSVALSPTASFTNASIEISDYLIMDAPNSHKSPVFYKDGPMALLPAATAAASVEIDSPAAIIGHLVTANGGKEGYDVTSQFAPGQKLTVVFDPYLIPDDFKISTDTGVVLVDTGFIGRQTYSSTIQVPLLEDGKLRVQVLTNDPQTWWTFTLAPASAVSQTSAGIQAADAISAVALSQSYPVMAKITSPVSIVQNTDSVPVGTDETAGASFSIILNDASWIGKTIKWSLVPSGETPGDTGDFPAGAELTGSFTIASNAVLGDSVFDHEFPAPVQVSQSGGIDTFMIQLFDGSSQSPARDSSGRAIAAKLDVVSEYKISSPIPGTDGNDLIYGTANDDVIYGGLGNDTINAGEGDDFIDGGFGDDLINAGGGNDTITPGFGNDTIDGGEGDDTVILQRKYADVNITTDNNKNTVITDNSIVPLGIKTISNVEHVVFSDKTFDLVSSSPANITIVDTTTGITKHSSGTKYSGPAAGVAYQYLNITPDNLNLTAGLGNSFLHTGSGFDAIDVSSVGGTNVLDGGTNSNFLVGGKNPAGSDTFFIDDRSPPADIWSTVVNFHAGDAATLFGITPNGFTTTWVDGEGAAGFTGLTLHVSAPGVPTASITLSGYTTADLGNGRLSQIFGTEGDGTPYLYIHGDS